MILLLFAAATVIISVNMNNKFGRYDYVAPEFTTDYYYEHYEKDYPRENITFTSGGNTLQGYIYGGDGTKGLPQSALDLNAALNCIENDAGLNALPRFLIGHSWGGYAVTAVMNFNHKVNGIVSVSGYAEPIEMIYEFAEGVAGNARPLLYPSMWLYNSLTFGEYAGLSAIEGINKTDTPILIIHGTEDTTIGYNDSAIMNKRSKITNPNAEFLTLEGCTHSGMFYTKEALELKDKVKKAVGSLKEKYSAKDEKELARLYPEELAEIYSSSDRDRINQPNEEFLSVADEYFNRLIEAEKAA